jgi:DNA helicase-2/ATP-dependent DNA helicase PcrA
MDVLLEGLNEAQKDAVINPARVVQVLAPPGSGKTKTLTARVAWLVSYQRLKPWNIIVCTFTKKAANEMKERIRGLVGDGIEAKLILGTFHSVARIFLVKYGQEIGIEKNFGIADSADSKAMITRIIKRNNYSTDPANARGRISGCKAKGISAEQFIATSSKKVDEHEFACIYVEYEDTLKSSNLLDYDDLLLRCKDLLQKHPACVSSIEAVLIDEYQDTNNVQYELMTLFAQYQKCITIVGDPDQSIFGWRAAEIENLYRMQKDYPDSLVINLEENYRSAASILTSAQAVIEQDENRPDKALKPTHSVGESPTFRHLATASVEAQWIVEEIQRSNTLAAGLLNLGDYAILLRASQLSFSIEKALGKAGIPYRMVGGTRFFDRAEIKIVLDYLRVINLPEHNDAVARIINVPARKVGGETIKGLLEEAEVRKISLWKLILGCAQGDAKPRVKISPQAQKGIDTFVGIIKMSRDKLFSDKNDGCQLFDLIGYVLQKIQFRVYLKAMHKENWEERWENVNELVAQATQMGSTIVNEEEAVDDTLPVVEGIEQRPDTAADVLSKFLANVALSTAVDRAEGQEPNQVTISTIHAAKGLEWPVVFIPAVYNGSIPHSRAEDHDEERRLLYVGMTRAQGLLYMSCPVKQSGQESTTLSNFISSPNIQKLFSRQGPSIGCSAIADLARILRRPCPTSEDVQAVRSSIERMEDDRYPQTREEIDGEDSSWGLSWDASYTSNAGSDAPYQAYKRRKIEPSAPASGIITSVTMHKASGFSVATTTLPSGNSGFTSARHVQLEQEVKAVEALVRAPSASAGRAAYEDVKKDYGTKQARTKGVKPRLAGQSAITGFFTKPGTAKAASDPNPPQPLPKMLTLSRSQSMMSQHAPLTDISDFQPAAPSTKTYQPPTFSSHRPRSIPMCSKPKRQETESESHRTKHVLLSSSPATPTDDGDELERPLGEIDNGTELDLPASPTKASLPTAISSFSGLRAASTFHTTSMGQLQSGVEPPKKRLGMGRSVQSWSVKHKQMPRPQH